MSAAEADVLATGGARRTGFVLPGRFLRSELAIVFGRRRNLVLLGVLAAIPVLAGLTGLAAPFGNAAAPDGLAAMLGAMPLGLWFSVACLPPLAATIGWITAQRTVRRWLRRLP
jgi:hypothetical protein